MLTGTAQVVRANARHLPLADDSVDLVVTSPPYFALRSYQDGGEHYAGQVGDEPTPAEFVASLLEVTRECVRVLKPSGSLWVNLGDKYGRGSRPKAQVGQTIERDVRPRSQDLAADGSPPKSLIGIPWRYALACIDDLGLILRAEVIWSKPNGLPESVTDRVRRSHETWFHFVLSPRYYSAVDEIREASAPPSSTALRGPTFGFKSNGDRGDAGAGNFLPSPLGKLPGSVWTIPTQPLQVPARLGVDHFAAFPMEWPRRIIAGWSPAGVCTACGQGRRPVSQRTITGDRGGRKFNVLTPDSDTARLGTEGHHTITGYACACSEQTTARLVDLPPTTPGVVLDPFGGTGTTALVAKALGRHGITIDMSNDYCRLAQWRTTDPDQLAAAMQVEKPPRQVAGQATLFDGEAAS